MWLIDLDGDLWNLDSTMMAVVFNGSVATILLLDVGTRRYYRFSRQDIDSKAFIADLARALHHVHATNEIVIDSREFESCREYIKSRAT